MSSCFPLNKLTECGAIFRLVPIARPDDIYIKDEDTEDTPVTIKDEDMLSDAIKCEDTEDMPAAGKYYVDLADLASQEQPTCCYPCYEFFGRMGVVVGREELEKIGDLKKELERIKRENAENAESVKAEIQTIKDRMRARDLDFKKQRVRIAGKYGRQCPSAMDLLFGREVGKMTRADSASTAQTYESSSRHPTPAASRSASRVSTADSEPDSVADDASSASGTRRGRVKEAKSMSPRPLRVTVMGVFKEMITGW